MKIVEGINNVLTNLKRLWVLIVPFKKHFFLCLFLIILNSLILGSFFSFLIPLISDTVSEIQQNDSSGLMRSIFDFYLSMSPDRRKMVFVVLSLLMLITHSVLGFAVAYNTAFFSAKTATHTRERLADSILHLKYSFVTTFKEGQIIQLIVTETRGVYAVIKQFFNLIVVVVQLIVLSTILIFISYKISLCLLLVGLLLLFINYTFVRRIKDTAKRGVVLRFRLMAFVKEMITNLSQIKINVLEGFMQKKLHEHSKDTEYNMRDVRILIELPPLFSQFIIIMAMFFVVFLSFKYNVFPSVMSPLGGLLSYVVVLYSLLPCVGRLNKAIGTMYSNLPSIRRVFEFLYNKDIHDNRENYEGECRETLLNKKIVFEGVHFHYLKGNKDKYVLEDLNFEIEKGDKIAIVGKSGVGKTTILNLILKLYDYDVDKGSIYFDDLDINRINIVDIRRKIGYVSQDIKLFNTTIRENLLYAKPDASFSQIQDACVKADAHDFIMSLSDKYDTIVGERGERLSEGQRQRIAIAQVFLKDPEIIILDEAVSSVDFESASNIRSVVFNKLKEKTIIVISHQMNAVLDVDKVLVLEGGTVKEFGYKNDLLRDPHSLFYKMYKSQEFGKVK